VLDEPPALDAPAIGADVGEVRHRIGP
jgi:hypothetical protein